MRVKLEDVCERGSSNLKQSDVVGKRGDYPVFGAAGQIGCVDFYQQERPYVAVVKDGAGIGRTTLLPAYSSIIGTMQYLLPKDNILPEYLCYVVRHMHLEKYFSGATIPHIYFKDYKSEMFNLGTIEKQEEIVGILGQVERVILNRKQQLQKLDELVKARFVEMFGDPEINSFDWPVCTLKELVSIEPQNGLYKPQSAYVQDGSGFPIVRIDAFYNGRITNFSTLKRLECSESEVQRYLLQENDIVINRVNSIEYLGKCAHIKGLLEETVFESNMMRLHLDDTVMNAVFATKLLCSQYIYKQIMMRAKKAVNQASINQQDVLSFRMFVPPLELQEQFAAFVEQTDKSKVIEAIYKTNTLFNITLNGGNCYDIRANEF